MAYLLFLILLIILAVPTAYAGFIGAPPLPTPYKAVRKMLEIADIKPDDTIYDLGVGDGRIIIIAAREFKTQAVGFEISPLNYILSWIKIRLSGTSEKAKVVYRNFYNQDLGKASAIFCFLRPQPMLRLKLKFQKELKPGTKVVSYAFKIPGWKPEKIVKVDEKTGPIYLYKIKK